ncbi:hypothetical protein BDV28DRAFT_164043 [Aspergillus coremiiformis]|uniref:non-specific serine/threonine protein kinase n=1 Tax=Aspergillus coremiiformis TaxID=138285 RepID=A0A5N6YTI2_9EURO|nr:hypothetical protein BDV28DRAFT_164043 [Aspergillus coremiiformis]
MDQKAMPLSPQSIRPPLVDASNRVDKYPTPRAVQGEGLMRDQHYLTSPQPMSIVTSPLSQKGYVDNNCVSPLIHSAVEFTRNSTVSADSIVSNQGKRKTHVGPWQLGKNLGEGATGRVRLAKHMSTGQTAAIKIVSKKSAAMAQSDSIAAMDRNIGFHSKTGVRQMPSGIEREVVIMKLIEHPNVVRLYDVWENRGELYLVLEYVEGGELFNYLSKYGPLEEFEAVKLFRQIIAGLAYCHRFSICHRDLKPENILLDSQHNVKLADFGMAALQPAGHWLKTSCGSPHYAAPEIIKGRNYRGDKADLWSCGIILFALLTGYLPFDGGDLSSTLRLVKTAKVEIPEHLSDEAADLIYQILQKRPEDRISMRDIWLHPLMRRYECLDPVLSNPFIGPAPPLSVHECGPPVHSRLDIEEELLRNLQTLWHDVKREALIEKLLNAEPTHERMFYNALIKFRNEQLENYQGQALEYSASDYHHMSRGPKRPSIPRNNGRSRGSRRRGQVPTPRNASLSSSVQEPKSSATVESYDPFRSPHHVVPEKESAYARITIHRDIPDIAKRCREAEGTVTSNAISEEDFEDDIECLPSSPFAVLRNKKKLSSVKSFQSRTSHTGTRRPLNGMATPRSASYKRNVCFRHVRNRSQGSAITKAEAAAERVVDGNMRENSLESIDVGPCAEQESSPLLPAQPGLVRGAGVALRTCAPQKTLRECDFIWREDARQVSHELSQICEEAFNGGSLSTVCTTTSTCMSPETPATSVAMMSPQVSHSRISTHNGKGPGTPSRCGGWPRSYTAAELAETRRKLLAHSTQDGSEDVPGYLVAVISHLDRLIEEDKLRQRDIDESVHVSVEESVTIAHEASGLSIISEAMDAGSDITHANSQSYRRVRPQSISTNSARISRDGLRTVRMVPQSSSHSIDIVRPLTIRKKSQQGAPQDNQHQHVDSQSTPEGEKIASSRFSSLNSRYSRTLCELDPIAEIPPKLEKCHATSYPENKKWSWLPIKSHIPTETTNRVPKPLHPSNGTVIVHEVKPSADPTTQSQHSEKNRVAAIGKHKGGFFRKLMKLKGSKSSHPTTSKQPHPNLANQREAESQATETIPILTGSTEALGLINADKPLPQRPRGSRKSVNWFSRMFQFKPATRVLALNVSKMKGRKEVYKILREWKPYGMKSVSLDKANSVIHGEVAENNLRRIRPVEFSAEFYTVLERGRQANLSLVQFKQEKGAVSSFNEVVDALHKEMKQRGLLEENPFRAKEMMEVLDKFDHL